jgi:exopolyphosphatase / guanosine-5'-triphosphate,3'-diphosphate pyrophosphatase
MPCGCPKERFDVDATRVDAPIRVGMTGLSKGHVAPVNPAATAMPKFGALDLGTNNCRLLIARSAGQGFVVVDAFSRIVRLGEGLSGSGRLSEAAMDRTIEALRVCSNKLKWHGVEHRRLIATEACRSADNGPQFIDRIKNEIGLVIEIIDRETEAGLAAAGAQPLIDQDAHSSIVFDIGGGSTEIMFMERDGQSFTLRHWTSLAAGVVTLSEGQGGGKHVTPEIYESMRMKVRELLRPFAEKLAAVRGGKFLPSHLLGTSGTVTTIAGVHLGLRHYDRARVDGCWIGSDDIDEVTARLVSMSYDERVKNGCIGHERADLVLAGCAIFDEIRRAFPVKRVRVADRGLREGILSSLMANHLKGVEPA